MSTTTTTAVPELEVTPRDLIASVRAARAAADAAEVEVLRLAVAWAHAHPELPGDESWHATRATAYDDGSPDSAAMDQEALEWFGIPQVRWDAPAAFAAANQMSTQAGRALIRDALVQRHRLLQVQARVLGGAVPVWQARRVAQAVISSPVDVVAYVDAEVAGRIDRSGRVGPVVLARIVDEAMLRLYPEERELAQLEALDARHATLHERTLNDTGIAEMTLRATWPDLKDFDEALSEVAAALAREATARGEVVECLGVRRSIAVGILADPAAALALLQVDPAWADKISRRVARVVVHLSDLALLGLDPVAQAGTGVGTVVLDQAVRQWCGRPGTGITVRPVIDLDVDVAREGYRPSACQVEQVALRDRTCVFAWCTRPAERSDIDHVVPHGPDRPDQPHDPRRAPCRWPHRHRQPRRALPTSLPAQDPHRVDPHRVDLHRRRARRPPLAQPPRPASAPHPGRHPRCHRRLRMENQVAVTKSSQLVAR